MRAEGWALGGGGGRGRGRAREGGKGKQEEKASVQQTASHATEFGWLFRPSEARRRSLVDTAWLRDFSRDIEALQFEIRKQTACVYNEVETICRKDTAAGRGSHSEVKWQGGCAHNEETRSHEDAARRESHSEIERLQSELRRHPAFVCRGERTRHNGSLLRTECHSLECCVAVNGDKSECCSPDLVKCEERLGAPARVASCGELAVSSSVQARVLDSSGVAISIEMASGGESSCGGSNRGLVLKEERGSPHCHDVVESSVSEMSCDLHSGLNTFRDDTAKCDVYSKLQHKEKTQRSASDEDSSVGEESFLSDPGLGRYASGSGKCDAYSSMHSDISRDSGIFTADDTSFISETPEDVSLLQELGDVLSDEEVSLESCIPCGSLPLKGIGPGIKGDVGYNVWLKRFSSSNDLSEGSWGSYEWEVKEDGEHDHKSCSFGSVSPVVARRKKWDSEDDDSNGKFREEEQAVKGKPCSGCDEKIEGVKVTNCRASQKLKEGVSVKQCAVCKNLYEGPDTKQRSANENRNESTDVQAELCMTCKMLYHESPLNLLLQTQRISAMAKFSRSFQGLNKRVENLRSGLDSLSGEVNKSKREFLSLERRTTQLLASTASSRHRLARVRALTLLEDRLQEEWWAAYDPGSVPFHENYIV